MGFWLRGACRENAEQSWQPIEQRQERVGAEQAESRAPDLSPWRGAREGDCSCASVKIARTRRADRATRISKLEAISTTSARIWPRNSRCWRTPSKRSPTSFRLWPPTFWKEVQDLFRRQPERTGNAARRRSRRRSRSSARRWKQAQTRLKNRRHQAGDADRHAGRSEPAVDRRGAQPDHGAARIVQGAGRLGRIYCAQSAGKGGPAGGRAVPRSGDLRRGRARRRAAKESRAPT